MLVVGAKGFAKEILQILLNNNYNNQIAFYDDIHKNDLLFDKYQILKNDFEVQVFLKENNYLFTIGIGNPLLRNKMHKKIIKLGGKLISTICNNTDIGHYDVNIQNGCNILSGVKISNSVTIGICCLIYYNSIIAHDVILGDFLEISPSVTILGHVKISDFVQIGANATILPNISIGNNSIIGAGSVVTKNIPDNVLVVGTPAKIIKYLS